MRLLSLVGVVWASSASAWSITTEEAAALQQDAARDLGMSAEREVTLPGGGALRLVLVPGGQFTMGAPEGESPVDPDESPQFTARVDPFWMAACEITNAQFALFDASHDSRFMDTYWKDRVGPGFPLNQSEQPVVRVSWREAYLFCEWLSQVTGERFRLPTEADWEYACRAGSDGPFACPPGELSAYANLADQSLAQVKPWALRDDSLNDGQPVSCPVGRFGANVWGLLDMHGNATEWCASLYCPYPLADPDAPVGVEEDGPRVVRGGSFDDRPRRARSAFRLSYPPDQHVYNVGFRVVAPIRPDGAVLRAWVSKEP